MRMEEAANGVLEKNTFHAIDVERVALEKRGKYARHLVEIFDRLVVFN